MTKRANAAAMELRRRAEEKFGRLREPLEELSPEEARQLLHELRVHQIELEMQNEELRRAQADLAQERERYFDLYELAPVGYLTLSDKGVIMQANLTAAAMLGVKRAFLLKKPMSQFILPEDQDVYYLQRKRFMEIGESQEWEMRLMRAYGSPLWALFQSALNAYGECWITFANITDRKKAEEDKLNLKAQLHQSQKMESIGRLAGGVAHDFNNMLSVIIGYADLALMKTSPPQPLHEYLEEIHKAGLNSASLTRQLLAFARKQIIAPRLLNLNEVVAGMLKMLKRLLGENIEISWRPGADLWPVLVDPSQIDQILANLCVNVRDAIADIGTMTIETENCALDQAWCAAHPGMIPGDYVRIIVSDNGCGMDRETLDHVFEPFFTTKGIGKGTGLGLSTVYGAVSQNKGFIDVASSPGEGTTFTTYLPRHLESADSAVMEEPAMPAVGGGETILLVEDEPSILEMTRVMLEMLGYRVLAASGPGEAISLAREHVGEIQLLMTDVIMPERNGRDLANNLQSLYPLLRVLFMSGYTADVIAPHFVLEEGVLFIQKPFSLELLSTRVRESLD